MDLTDRSEQVRLKNWAALNEDRTSLRRVKTGKQDSFWITRESEDTYIMPYDFDTLPEFEDLCKKVMKTPMDSTLQRVIAVAAFKNMPEEELADNNSLENNERLPEYRYVF